jgi:hypothetical protein
MKIPSFVISGCSSRPLTRLAFVGRDHILTLPARKLGALQVSCQGKRAGLQDGFSQSNPDWLPCAYGT